MLAFSKRPTVSYCPQVYDALSTLDKHIHGTPFRRRILRSQQELYPSGRRILGEWSRRRLRHGREHDRPEGGIPVMAVCRCRPVPVHQQSFTEINYLYVRAYIRTSLGTCPAGCAAGSPHQHCTGVACQASSLQFAGGLKLVDGVRS